MPQKKTQPTIPELVQWAAAAWGELAAIRDGNTVLSHTELGAQVDRSAHALVGSGVEPNDTVVVWDPNC